MPMVYTAMSQDTATGSVSVHPIGSVLRTVTSIQQPTKNKQHRDVQVISTKSSSHNQTEVLSSSVSNANRALTPFVTMPTKSFNSSTDKVSLLERTSVYKNSLSFLKGERQIFEREKGGSESVDVSESPKKSFLRQYQEHLQKNGTSVHRQTRHKANNLSRPIITTQNLSTITQPHSSEVQHINTQGTDSFSMSIEKPNVTKTVNSTINYKIDRFTHTSSPSKYESKPTITDMHSSVENYSQTNQDQGRVKLLSSKLETRFSSSALEQSQPLSTTTVHAETKNVIRHKTTHSTASSPVSKLIAVAPTNAVDVHESLTRKWSSLSSTLNHSHSQTSKILENTHDDNDKNKKFQLLHPKKVNDQVGISNGKKNTEITSSGSINPTRLISARNTKKIESTDSNMPRVPRKTSSTSIQKRDGSTALSTTSSNPSTTTTTVSNSTVDDSVSSLPRTLPPISQYPEVDLNGVIRPSVSKVQSLLWDNHKQLKWQKKVNVSMSSSYSEANHVQVDHSALSPFSLPTSNVGNTGVISTRNVHPYPDTLLNVPSFSHPRSSPVEKESRRLPPVKEVIENLSPPAKVTEPMNPTTHHSSCSPIRAASPSKWKSTAMDPTVMRTRFGFAASRTSKLPLTSHSLIATSPSYRSDEKKTVLTLLDHDHNMRVEKMEINLTKASSISSDARSTDMIPKVTRTTTTTLEDDTQNRTPLLLQKGTKGSICDSSTSTPNKRSNASTELVRITSNGAKNWNGWEQNKTTLHISSYDIHMSMRSEKEEFDSMSDDDLHSDSTLSSITNPTFLGYEVVEDGTPGGGVPKGKIQLENFIVHGRSIASRIKSKENQDDHWFNPPSSRSMIEEPPTDLFSEPVISATNMCHLHSPERPVKLPAAPISPITPSMSLEKIDCTESLKRIQSSPRLSPLKSYILNNTKDDTCVIDSSTCTMVPTTTNQDSSKLVGPTVMATVENSEIIISKSSPQNVVPMNNLSQQVFANAESGHRRNGSFPMLTTVLSYGSESSNYVKLKANTEKRRTGSLPPSKREKRYPEKKTNDKVSSPPSSHETNPYLRRKYKALTMIQP